MLYVDHLSKSFLDENGNEKIVLDDISFLVKDHEFVCVLGKKRMWKEYVA